MADLAALDQGLDGDEHVALSHGAPLPHTGGDGEGRGGNVDGESKGKHVHGSMSRLSELALGAVPVGAKVEDVSGGGVGVWGGCTRAMR